MKIALSILTLGLSLWALPALATPSDQNDSRGKSEASASRSGKHDVDLRLDGKDNGVRNHGNGAYRTRYESAQDGKKWKGEWTGDKAPNGGGALVPEPSAMMLFGAGLLVALQAIPLRSSRAQANGDAGGMPDHG